MTESNQRMLPRDIEAGCFVGEGYEVAQYQVQEACFGDLSPTVCSRFKARWESRGFLKVTRRHSFGANHLSLTSRGRQFLIKHGCDERRLFVPRRPVSSRNLDHHVLCNDVRAACVTIAPLPEELAASWLIERILVDRPVVPDVVGLYRMHAEDQVAVLAVEVDRGTEALDSIFLKKLERLQTWLASTRYSIVVLTSSVARANKIRSTIAMQQHSAAFFVVDQLPEVSGRASVDALRALLKGAVGSLTRSSL